MYNAAFFRTKLGQASLASIAAMIAMITLTSQVDFAARDAHLAGPASEGTMLVELA